MPIRAANRELYAGPEYHAFRELVRGRAGDKCQSCSVKNHDQVFFTWSDTDPDFDRALWWDGHHWIDQQGVCVPWENVGPILRDGPNLKTCRYVRVVCGVSHTDHDPRHRDPERAQWLCSRCHLLHDQRDNHARKRRLRAAASGQGWLLDEVRTAAMPEGT